MDKLDIQHVADDGQVVELALKGRLDVLSYVELKDYFDKSQDKGRRSLVLDMSGVDYVGSSGWSVLFVQAGSLAKAGKWMVVCNMNARVAHTLGLILPKKRLDVAKDVAAARALIQTRLQAAEAEP